MGEDRGVKLGVNKKTGEIEFKGNNDNAKFSKTGRDEIMKMVTGKGQVTVDFTTSRSSQTEGNNIYLNPSQIDRLINGASSDLNSSTASYGMVTLHEYNHTDVGGAQRHGQMQFGTIDRPDIVGNQIRNEMSAATGTNWGQRESYSMMSINGTMYMPLSSQSQNQIQFAKRYEGTWQGFLMYQPPTTSVITMPPEL